MGTEGNRFEGLQQNYVQQVVQNALLIGARVHDVVGDLLQVGSQRLGHRVMQVQYGRLGLAEEERVLSVGRGRWPAAVQTECVRTTDAAP